MYENIYGLSCVENQVLAILAQRKERIALTYHDCAVPVQELYTFMVDKGIKQENFNYPRRVQDILQDRGIISFVMKRNESINVLYDEMEHYNLNEYVLIRVKPEFSKRVLHTRSLRADHYVLLNAVQTGYQLYNDIPEHIVELDKHQLSEAFDGDYLKMTVLRSLSATDADDLWYKRICKPECMQYSEPVMQIMPDISEYSVRLRNLTGVYKTLRRRMVEYYGIYADTGFIYGKLPQIDKIYSILEYNIIRKNKSEEKYQSLLIELYEIDSEILTQIKKILGDTNYGDYVREKNKRYFGGAYVS